MVNEYTINLADMSFVVVYWLHKSDPSYLTAIGIFTKYSASQHRERMIIHSSQNIVKRNTLIGKLKFFVRTTMVLDCIPININSWKGEACPWQKVSCITDLGVQPNVTIRTNRRLIGQGKDYSLQLRSSLMRGIVPCDFTIPLASTDT